MFCPKCRYEYRPEVTTCPDCDEPLVSRIPEPSEDPTAEDDIGDWIPLARMASREYAEMIIGALNERDIPAVIHSGTGHFGQTGQMGVSSHNPIGGRYLLLVPDEYSAEADTVGMMILGEEWVKARLADSDR
ncbi:MAG: hypothetical protein JSW34_09150 [Candidatus Zixiibacteriota bacterium]|nr:MAG: hypothetical protein JSW34_09150 [candidate division Zixibacteria bacterium]